MLELPPFTYFTDVDGLIFYAEGWSPEPGRIAARLVYVPDPDGDRFNEEGHQFTKYIFSGTRAEFPRALRLLPPETVRSLVSKCAHEELTGQQYLSIPSDDIDRIFDPRRLIRDHSHGRTAPRFARLLDETIARCAQVGLAVDDLGVYGGMQCGITRVSGPRDIDLLVDGLRNYDKVLELCHGHHVDVSDSILRSPEHPEERDAIKCRARQSRFPLSDKVSVDIRILRTAPDTTHMTSEPTFLGEAQLRRAAVIESSESLSLPMSVLVESDGRTYWVCSRYYHHLGVARRGDLVNVFGLLTSTNQIHLTDPDTHFIRLPPH